MREVSHDSEADLDELVEVAKARLTVLHRLDEARLWGASDRKLDRLAALLFRTGNRETDGRAEKMSLAATRVAFCASPATRQWLVSQESLLFSCRLRLGEKTVPRPEPEEADGDDDDAKNTNANANASTNHANQPFGSGSPGNDDTRPETHRWVDFERAFTLIRRREPGVTLRNGRCRVPDSAMPEVLVEDFRKETTRALFATQRRLRHALASARGAGAFGTPGAVDAMSALVWWKPGRPTREENARWVWAEREDTEKARRRAVRQGAPAVTGTEDLVGIEDLVASDGYFFGSAGYGGGGGVDGFAKKTGWSRGWRKRKRDGHGAPPATSLTTYGGTGTSTYEVGGVGRGIQSGNINTSDQLIGSSSAFGGLPIQSFAPPVGADAKRALRVIRKGVDHAAASVRPFPLCVRRSLQKLHTAHHLPHEQRFQLTLFFKGIDLSAEETLHVWRQQFGYGKMNDFKNEHQYAVRHAFGLEGKMADYPPLTCEKLGGARKASGTQSGFASCPFAAARGVQSENNERTGNNRNNGTAQTSPVQSLRNDLDGLVSFDDVERIVEIAKKGDPKAACAAFFRATHVTNAGDGGDGVDNVDGGNAGTNVTTVGGTAHSAPRTYCGDDDSHSRENSGTGKQSEQSERADIMARHWVKFPHDYYDRSVCLEEAARDEDNSKVVSVAEKKARPRIELEMESDSDSEDEEPLFELGHRDR